MALLDASGAAPVIGAQGAPGGGSVLGKGTCEY